MIALRTLAAPEHLGLFFGRLRLGLLGLELALVDQNILLWFEVVHNAYVGRVAKPAPSYQ